MDWATTAVGVVGGIFSVSVSATWALALYAKTGAIYLGIGLLYVLGWVYAFIAWPISTLYSTIALLLSPIVYPILYALAPVFFLIRLVPKFEPLYIYLGSAAFVGSLVGISLILTSRTIESILLPAADESIPQGRLTGRRPSAIEGAPPSPLDSIEDDMSSLDDWAWMEKFKTMKTEPVLAPVLTKPGPSKRRHHHSEPPGAIATILEESSAE